MSTGAQVAMSAVIGGTAGKLGGGKFANGAVTGAYGMMFNHLTWQNRINNDLEKSRAELRSKLNEAIQNSHEFYQNGGAYAENDNAFLIDFKLESFTPNKHTLWLGNTFEDITISVGTTAFTVDIKGSAYSGLSKLG